MKWVWIWLNMRWSSQGIILSVRPFAETGSIAKILTQDQGLWAGLVRGGAGKKAKSTYQPGNLVSAEWTGRLAENLGAWRCELERPIAAKFFEDKLRLAAIRAVTQVVENALPEKDPLPSVFAGLFAWLETLQGDHWLATLVQLELGLLSALGYGLDLTRCAATGSTKDLAFVSPKSGRAVSRHAAEPYKDRLLPLPGFLTAQSPLTDQDEINGLRLTGYFLEKMFFAVQNKPLPQARILLMQLVS